MTAAPVVAARGLRKAYGAQAVLHDLDLDVRAGELVGLVGPNGAGKSTLLRILMGLVRRSGGSVTMFGLDPGRDPIGVRSRCSYLPGETSVYRQMTGRQFLDFALSFQPRHNGPVLERLLALFALPLRDRVRTYSAGMQQKLAILAALAPDVDLYLLDEPDRALDASMRLQLRDVLLELRRLGKTILLSSHHLSELETLAARIEFLRAGRRVPAAEVAAARARLRRRFRVRLEPAVPLPAGVTLLARDGDGTLVLEAATDPLLCLQALPGAAVQAAELGVVRLEDLYQLLFLAGTPAEAAAT